MRQDVTLQSPGASPERRTLAQRTTAGGSRADGLFVPDAPPGALVLVPVAAGVVVEAGAAGVRVGGHGVAPGGRRLLRAGERAELHGTAIAMEGASSPEGATRIAAAALLRDAAAGEKPIGGPRLVVLTGPAAGERHALGAEQTLGRGRAATVRIADPQASRVHARVRLGPGGATIEDLRSKNGLRLNGVRVDRRPWPLRAGDEIALGETVLVLEDPAPAPPPRAGGDPAPVTAARARARRIPARLAAAALLALSAAALALAGS
ncbi:MAG TPA: FHA domain-containing protein [Anaeromyxobacter sp.]